MSFFRCPKCDKFETNSRKTCSKCGYREVCEPSPATDKGRQEASKLPETLAAPALKLPGPSAGGLAKWLRRAAIVTACLGPLMVIAMCLGAPLLPVSNRSQEERQHAMQMFLAGIVIVPLALYILSRLLENKDKE